MTEPKIGDKFEFLAEDMAPGVSRYLNLKGMKFTCRIVSLIYKAGRCVATGIIWECDEEYKNASAKMLLNENFMGRLATEWAHKGVKVE